MFPLINYKYSLKTLDGFSPRCRSLSTRRLSITWIPFFTGSAHLHQVVYYVILGWRFLFFNQGSIGFLHGWVHLQLLKNFLKLARIVLLVLTRSHLQSSLPRDYVLFHMLLMKLLFLLNLSLNRFIIIRIVILVLPKVNFTATFLIISHLNLVFRDRSWVIDRGLKLWCLVVKVTFRFEIV